MSKVFNRKAYSYKGILRNPLDDRLYFGFECIKEGFSSEFVLVRSAKMIYDDGGFVYFDESTLRKLDLLDVDPSKLPRVKLDDPWQLNLAKNEINWSLRRRDSEVKMLSRMVV